MSEYAELKQSIEEVDKKMDRILSWAEGDEKLGTPSVNQMIRKNSEDIVDNRKLTHKNRDVIRDNTNDLKNLKKTAGVVGAGGGGIIAVIIESFKAVFS
jgi:hypothetical protein